MLVHTGGIDFTQLQPTWLAIGLFVALPGVFGTLIGSAVDAVSRPDSWTIRARRRWLLPLIAVSCFPLSFLFLLIASVILGISVLASDLELVQRVRRAPFYAPTIRSLWLFIAVAGLVALINDIAALT